MPRPNTAPIFAGELDRARATISAADTAFDGSDADAVEVYEVPTTRPNGVLLRKITIEARGTTTAGQIKLYLSEDAGTTRRPWRNVLVSAITAAAAVIPFWAQLDDQNDEELANGLSLPVGWSLVASTHNAEGFEVHAEFGVL